MKIVIGLKTHKEDQTPAQAAKAGYAPGFVEVVKKVQAEARKLNPKSRWGWCMVEVRAKVVINGLSAEGSDYLGGCSYTSELDFVLNSCYFDGMMKRAIEEAIATLRSSAGKVLGKTLQLLNH